MRLLQDYAIRAADVRGDADALVLGEERLTYAELERTSDRLAAQLVAAGCEPGDRVGLLVPKRPSAIVAMQAVLKAGCAYVPLDAESPPQRLARIVAAAEPRLLLAVPEAAERLDALAEALVLPPVWSLEAEPVTGERVSSERARPSGTSMPRRPPCACARTTRRTCCSPPARRASRRAS